MHATTQPETVIVTARKGHGLGNQQGSRVSREALREVLDYNPDTGVFRWRVTTSNRSIAGNIAGGRDNRGYVQIRVLGRKRWAHRLAWLLMTGDEPDGLIDHINGDKSDNRFANLRLASRGQNSMNQRQKPHRALPKGVYQYDDKHGGRPYAQIRFEKQTRFLGAFDTVQAAKSAYDRAAVELFGEFANLEPSTTSASHVGVSAPKCPVPCS